MSLPDAGRIYEITEKFRSEGDISPEEADEVYSLLSNKCIKNKLNPERPSYEPETEQALLCWFREILAADRPGMFLATFPLDKRINTFKFRDIWLDIARKMSPVDRIAFVEDRGILNKLPDKDVKFVRFGYLSSIYSITRAGFFRRYGLLEELNRCAPVSAISSYSGYEHRHLYFDGVENIQTVASDAVCHFVKKEYLKHLAVKYFGEKEWVFLMKRDEAEIIEEIAEKVPGMIERMARRESLEIKDGNVHTPRHYLFLDDLVQEIGDAYRFRIRLKEEREKETEDDSWVEMIR